MAYTAHTWSIGEPITQEKMNHIEQGIADSVDSASLTSAVNSLNSAINSVSAAVQTANYNASLAVEQVNQAAQNAQYGYNAWTQVSNAITIDETGTITQSLNERIGVVEASTTAINAKIGGSYSASNTVYQHIGRVEGDLSTLSGIVDRAKGSSTDLQARLDRVDNTLSTYSTAIAGINTLYNNATGEYEHLEDRFGAIEQELQDTHNGNDYESLDERLEAMAASITANAGNITSLTSTVVFRNDVKNDFISSDTDLPLSALRGKELRDIIGGTYDPYNANIEERTTVTSMINQARNTSETNAKNYADANKVDKVNIYNGLDYVPAVDATDNKVLDARQGKVLAERIDAIDNSTTGTVHLIDGRLSTVESSLTAALTSSVIRTPGEEAGDPDTDTTYASLDERLEAIEAHAASMRTDVDTIANELDMYDISDNIVATNSRIDQIETNVVAMANEIGMLQDGSAVEDMSSAISGASSRIDGLETRLDSLDTPSTGVIAGIDGRLTTVEGTINTPTTGLTARISALENEPKSATTIVAELPAEGSADVDYLLGPDENGRYFYYKWIEDGASSNWKLISGGSSGEGGSGTSSAEILAQLPQASAADPNIDYYIGNAQDGYVHYRYIPSEQENEDGAFISILPNNIVNSVSVGNITVTTADALGDTPATTASMSGKPNVYALGDTEHTTNLLNNFNALRYARLKRTFDTDGTTLKKQELIFTYLDGTEMAPIEIVGGSGAGAAYTVRLLGGSTFSVPSTQTGIVNISPRPIVNFGNTLAEGIEITATVQYKLSTSNVWQNATVEIPQITNNLPFNINIASLLGAVGTTTNIRVTISTQPDGSEGDVYTQSALFNISKVNMSIASINYNPAAIRTGSSFQFNYTCIGVDLSKTVIFKIDGTTVAEENIGTSHNESLSETLSLTSLATGMHTLYVYFIANNVQSNIINTYLICNKDSEREAPLVGLSFPYTEINYGDDLTFNYTVYTPGAGIETTDAVDIEIYTMNNDTKTVIDTIELIDVDNSVLNTQTIVTYPENVGNDPYTLYVTLTATKNGETPLTDSQTASIQIKPFASKYTMNYAGVSNLVYQYTAYGRTNNDANKETYNYVYTAHDANTTDITFTGSFNNFNWSTDGYTNGEALTISGGATHTINVPIFSSSAQGVSIETDTDSYIDPTQNGRTIEIDYMVRSATDLTDVIMSCMGANHAGFKITPQNCYLLNSNVNVSLDSTGAILNESAIAAAYLTTGTRIHLVFVIEPWAAEKAYDQKYHQSVNIYINGEFANACPYNRDNSTSTGNVVDSFTTDATITMGSPSCIIDLYSVKLYNRGLTHTEVLQNYKMAPASMSAKTARFENNDVIKNGVVDYELARKKFNCLLLVGPNPVYATNERGQQYNTMPTISPYKGAPSPINRLKDGEVVGKTESGLILTRPNSDENHPEGYQVEFELLDKMTDDGYASSNNVQGTSSQKYPIHNLKVYLMKGTEGQEELDPETNEPTGRYKKSEKVKYKIPGSKGKGESTLCWKADYMSTDHANTFNANIADSLFSESLNPNITNDDWRNDVQNTVNGIRCLLFQQQGDNPPEFVADGCLNNDKGNSKTYGLEYTGDNGADTTAQKWEFTNNSDALGFFKYDSIFLPTGNDNHYRALDAFESCYPDQGDLGDAQNAYKAEHDGAEDPNLNPNYNHLQVLLTWVSQRANYWDETDPTIRAAKKEIFRTEFTRHFNLDHVLVYYLFSEYVALCDNRVKNMFLRSDTIRSEVIRLIGEDEPLFEGNSNPNADFWKEFTAIDTGEIDEETSQPVIEYKIKNANQIDWVNSTFAIWAPVLYDLDSCFGVENVGYLKIPYNADWQYYQDGQYLFNGHDSVFWLMFEDTFSSEIAAKALTLYNRDRGLNYNTFYQEQIIGNNEEIAPAMTNQDMLLKYDDPWATGFMNYGNKPPTYETPEYKYLQRGSRATQKTSFIFKRSMLLSSKYQTNAFKNDRISMRYGADVSVANAVVKLSGNQIFYPAVSFGDNKGWTQALELEDGTPVIDGRVNAGEVCRIRATSPAGGQDTLFIGGASVLTDVGDLSVFKAYEINVSSAVNLKKIAFGSHAEGYINEVTSSIGGLSSCILLEEINIENCTNFQSLDLSANGLIKKVYATGSGASSISIPTGGVLEILELGANTNNITILNQSHLTTFSYENSEVNHYANLNKLWIENTPNIPIVDIITNAISHLTGGIRLIGIDVNLGDDPTFLQVITSDLAKGKYMTNTGTCPPGNTNPPTITGNVRINSIRQSLYNTLRTMYPNLTITAASVIPEYTITYIDYDGTVLYTDYKTSQERYIDPVKDINPITNIPYISMPTRPSSVQYDYYFGLYSSNSVYTLANYTRFSGWLKRVVSGDDTYLTNEYVTGTTTLVASYRTTEVRQYTVEWFAETTDTEPIKTITTYYGTRISDYTWPDEDGTLIRAKLVNDSYYKVFTGWSQPVGILTGNTKVYAQWKSSDITNATTSVDFSTLSGADLYALGHIGAQARTNLLQSHFNLDTIIIPMGHDFNYTTGVNTYDLVGNNTLTFSGDEIESIVFDGTSGHQEIRPFEKILNPETGEMEYKDFTLAIDYKFLLTTALASNTEEYVLASCYKQTANTKEGFKIVLKNTDSSIKPIVVTWGSGTTSDTYTIIDYVEINNDSATNTVQYSRSYRNIVVLSFSKDDPTHLNVYCPMPSSTPSLYDYDMKTVALTWTAPNIDTPLIFGGNYNYTSNPTQIETSTQRYPAAGLIYWAKFWDADLGGNNCNKLASWPHEKLHFYLSGYNSHTSETSKLLIDGTNLTFVTASVIGDRRYNAQGCSFSNNFASWSNSSTRAFYNDRLYSALPDEYQSVILAATITSNSSQRQTFENITTTITTTSTNYLFPPAWREVNDGSVSQSMGREANRIWPWLTTDTLGGSGIVYGFVANSTTTLEPKASVADVNPFRYRFSGYYINASTKVFRMSTNPYNNGRSWTVRNAQPITLAGGDIWDTGTAVYVYVTAADIAKGIKIDIAEAQGGWKAAETWQLRTYTEAQEGTIWRYFAQVDAVGQVQDGANLTTSSYGQYKGLVFEFAV